MTEDGDNDIMSTTMGVAEAKRHFSELIDRVLRGERIVVTRRGKPVMALSRPEPEDGEPGEPRYLGLLAFAGIMEGVMTNEEVDQMVADIYEDRRRSTFRDLPPELLE